MKNSAWYQKLWRNKLNELPVKDPGADWANMRTLLDEQLPVGSAPATHPDYSSITRLIKILLGYVLPVVIIIGAGVYYELPVFHQSKTKKVRKFRAHPADSIKKTGVVYADSIPGQNNANAIQPITDHTTNTTGQASPVANGIQKPSPIVHGLKAVIPMDTSISKLSIAYPGKAAAQANNPSVQNSTQISGDGHHSTLQGTSTNFAAKKEEHIKDKVDSNGSADQGLKNNQPAMSALAPNILQASPTGAVGNNGSGPEKTNLTGSENQGQTLASDKRDNQKRSESDLSNQKAFKHKETTIKPVKNKPHQVKAHQGIITPRYNYGIDAGLNVGGGNSSSFYFGGFGAYALKPRLLINIGVHVNTYRTLSGSFTHDSYYRPDSLPPFAVADTRKVMVLDLPITVEYKLSNLLSIKAGPVISLPFKQSAISTTLGPIADIRDTVYHSAQIKSAISSTKLNTVNLGFTGGISVHIQKFEINGSYQLLNPYKISNSLGNYNKTYQTFQVGIGWRFR
jgi:hypothetical protein